MIVSGIGCDGFRRGARKRSWLTPQVRGGIGRSAKKDNEGSACAIMMSVVHDGRQKTLGLPITHTPAANRQMQSRFPPRPQPAFTPGGYYARLRGAGIGGFRSWRRRELSTPKDHFQNVGQGLRDGVIHQRRILPDYRRVDGADDHDIGSRAHE